MFTWNYRIVNDKRGNGGEDWYVLQEVTYNKAGQPNGYSSACVGSEDMDGMTKVWEMLCSAMEHPPLQPEDFVKYEREESEDD